MQPVKARFPYFLLQLWLALDTSEVPQLALERRFPACCPHAVRVSHRDLCTLPAGADNTSLEMWLGWIVSRYSEEGQQLIATQYPRGGQAFLRQLTPSTARSRSPAGEGTEQVRSFYYQHTYPILKESPASTCSILIIVKMKGCSYGANSRNFDPLTRAD